MEEEVSPGTRLTATAEAQVDKLVEGAVLAREQQRVLRRQVRNLRIGGGVMAVLLVLLGLVAWQAHVTASNLRTDSVNSCENGNSYRAGTVASFNRLVQLLEGPSPAPDVRSKADGYLKYVAEQNAPRNCEAAFSAQ